jgi:hypothetical protein
MSANPRAIPIPYVKQECFVVSSRTHQLGANQARLWGNVRGAAALVK